MKSRALQFYIFKPLVEFGASLAGRICESESIVFKRISLFSKYSYSGHG